MTEGLILGIFAFLVVVITLFEHLTGSSNCHRSAEGKGELTSFKKRRFAFFFFKVAVPFLVGICFFSYGVSVWNPVATTVHVTVKKGEFKNYSLAYLENIEESKPDSSPFAWQEIQISPHGKDNPAPLNPSFDNSGEALQNPASVPAAIIFSSLS